jgi:hypothetical protein
VWGFREGIGRVDGVLPGRGLPPATQDPVQSVWNRVEVIGETIVMQIVIFVFDVVTVILIVED